MTKFTPNTPYNVPFFIMIPDYETVKGTRKKIFKKVEETFFCSFRTFGGTEKVVNDVVVVENTGIVETWFEPNITSKCNIEINGQIYEILGTPENINMRNQFMVFKVRAIQGGA